MISNYIPLANEGIGPCAGIITAWHALQPYIVSSYLVAARQQSVHVVQQ